MFHVMNCSLCGKLVKSTPSGLCAVCLLERHHDVQKIKDYITRHPHASFMDVVQSTGVPFRTVRSLLA
jgi:predicted amidophosphoribosyltransferase